jgi:hypothetical protein
LPFERVDAGALLVELLSHGLQFIDELCLLGRRRPASHDEAEADRAG